MFPKIIFHRTCADLAANSKPDTIVTFIIGKREFQQTFMVHKSFATLQSPFFRAAFDGIFQEGTTQTMKLGDIEGHIFGLLVNWLYFQVVEELETTSLVPEVLVSYGKLWILAERCLIPKLQNAIMKRMVNHAVKRKVKGPWEIHNIRLPSRHGTSQAARC